VRRRLRPWMGVLLVALAYVGLTLARHSGDPLAFALVGTRYSQGDPQGSPGYDGQFAYYIARDPTGGWRYCDAPAYRYQRILYPFLAWALALGRPEGVGWALVALNVVALAGGTYVTEQLLAARGVSRWYALAYGLYGGLVAGLRLDLTEPLAYGLVQAGLWVWENRRLRITDCRLQIPIRYPQFAIGNGIIRAGSVGKRDGADRRGGVALVPGSGAPLAGGGQTGGGSGVTLRHLAVCAVDLAGQPRRGGWRCDGDIF